MKASLRELRARHGMRQADVAAAIGVNSAIYNAWENLDAEVIKKLAELYKVKPADISLPMSINRV